MTQIKPYQDAIHRPQVIQLFRDVLGYQSGHNAPALVIDKKLAVQDGLFFVALDADAASGAVMGTVLAGYDGHRGWLYSVAVHPLHQHKGIGSALVRHAEQALTALGCMKINLQIVGGNEAVSAFYAALGYEVETRVSMGRRIDANFAPKVVAVSLGASHSFSKSPLSHINLIKGHGVEGDAHCGVTVKHRSRVARDPTQPNLRQVHLMHTELLDELAAKGFAVAPGDLGENITTSGVALLGLPMGTLIQLGESAVVELTGLRNPCAQLDHFQPGLMAATLDRSPQGELIRKAGVMGVVIRGGVVRPGDGMQITLPSPPRRNLEPV
jgi:MOSC domain-containing protein YiiM/ribosomal protein S18 acetylase RimI-like enzyme